MVKIRRRVVDVDLKRILPVDDRVCQVDRPRRSRQVADLTSVEPNAAARAHGTKIKNDALAGFKFLCPIETFTVARAPRVINQNTLFVPVAERRRALFAM